MQSKVKFAIAVVVSTLGISIVAEKIGSSAKVVRLRDVGREIRGGACYYPTQNNRCPSANASCDDYPCEQVPDPDGGNDQVYMCNFPAAYTKTILGPFMSCSTASGAYGSTEKVDGTTNCGIQETCTGCAPDNNDPPTMSCSGSLIGGWNYPTCAPSAAGETCGPGLAQGNIPMTRELLAIARLNGYFFTLAT